MPQIAFSLFQNGQWDIFSISNDGGEVRQLTNDRYEDMDPAFSPDGRQLVYASRRDRNWDLYLLDLATGVETRLTRNPHYDGDPAWKPNGKALAFESYRNGDLDVWVLDLQTMDVRNLTADSTAGDFDPAWDPTGQTIVFSSWRGEDIDLWSVPLNGGDWTSVTALPGAELAPRWDPGTEAWAFSRYQLGNRDLWRLSEDELPTQVSWLGNLHTVDFNSTGDRFVGVYHDFDGARLAAGPTDGRGVVDFLSEKWLLRGGLSWHPAALPTGAPVETVQSAWSAANSFYTEDRTPSQSSSGEPYDLVRLSNIETGSPWLADTVNDSFEALRTELRAELGYDFFSQMSEIHRGLDFSSAASQYSSWHKTGRAFDTLFELPGDRMKIVREEIGGETFWRIWLRCQAQDGSCGVPITANPWDYSRRARTELAPEQGGVEADNLYGYYVDFSQLALQYGWDRISGYDDEDFSWTWHFKAFEYWHYNKKLKDDTGTEDWYEAMLEVYPPGQVAAAFNWDVMRAADEDPYLVVLKGVPVPPKVRQWWRTLRVE